MKMQAELELQGITREKLESFLKAVPQDAKLSVDIVHSVGDRPGESDSDSATLIADWTVDGI